MKKLAILFSFVFLVAGVFSQKNEVQNAINYLKPHNYDLGKAKEAIEKALNHTTTNNYYKAWYYAGKIYIEIYESKNQEYKSLDDNALEKSYNAFVKTRELDTKKRYIKETDAAIKGIAAHFFNQGTLEYNDGIEAQIAKKNDEAPEHFDLAYESFVKALEIYAMPEYNRLDTTLIFSTGLAAFNAKKYDKAVEYFNKCLEYKYGGEDVYLNLSSIYKFEGDTVKAVATLEEGISAYPDGNLNILTELIVFYVNAGKSDESLNYINMAIEKNPENNGLHHVKAGLFDQLGEFDKAVEAYKRAIEINPDFVDSQYNLGILYYNEGGEKFNAANSITDNDEYNKVKAEGEEYFKLSLPYLEKAHELEPAERATLDILKRITYRLGLLDRNKEINELLKNLGK